MGVKRDIIARGAKCSLLIAFVNNLLVALGNLEETINERGDMSTGIYLGLRDGPLAHQNINWPLEFRRKGPFPPLFNSA